MYKDELMELQMCLDKDDLFILQHDRDAMNRFMAYERLINDINQYVLSGKKSRQTASTLLAQYIDGGYV